MAFTEWMERNLYEARREKQIGDMIKSERNLGSTVKQTAAKMKDYSMGVDEVDIRSRGMSRTLKANELSFAAVGESVANAVLKVSLWIVATSLVMGATRKMGEVIQLWKDLEITLERIGITTSTMGQDLYKFFDLTADVAIRMGMPIEQTLKGMDLALRATASYEDQAKRASVATLMLRDAAILGNVAGMGFDQAIDILVGSLKQTGMELDQGIVLLDKWVAVAKGAAVSVNDLSQGFAIMSSAAASAGLNVDQVNGLITSLTEATTLGSVEVGNAIRALMATLYNPGSITTIGKFGVAVRDATGEFRSFWDVMNELSSMSATGALDKNQILQIAKAAGAGQRRYAQFVALLENWDAAVRASTISSEAQGDALNANERIVNTLTNAWDQYSAAQNKFWYAFGERSGILEDMTAGFQGLAGVFSSFANLSEPLSKAAKVITELAIAIGILKLAMVGLAHTGMAGLAKRTFLPLAAFAGMGGRPGIPPGVVRTGAGLQAGAGGFTTAAGRQYAGGQFVPRTVMTAPVLGGAKQAWGGLGRGMISPSRSGMGIGAGTLIGGMVMREVYQSDWSGIGGALGGGVGMYLMGPAGALIGSVIGGGIAKLIEGMTDTFEEKVAKEREKWIKDLPAELQQGLKSLSESLDVTGLITKPLAEVNEGAELTAQRIAEIQAQIAKDTKELSTREAMSPTSVAMMGQGAASHYQRMGQLEQRIQGSNEALSEMTRLEEKIAQDSTKVLTIQDELAVRAEEIRNELNLQASAEVRVTEIKKKALELTQQERDEQLSLAQAVPITYSRMLAQLERYAPAIAAQFRALYPSYEDFVELDPAAYAPLIEALGTLADKEEQIAAAQGKITAASQYMSSTVGGTETTLANITKHYEYWAELQQRIADNDVNANTLLMEYADALGIKEEDRNKTLEKATNLLNKMVIVLGEAKDAQENLNTLTQEQQTALSVIPGRQKYMQDYVEPGRLEFLETGGTAKIADMLTRYEDMFGKYLASQKQVYHSFIKDEEGIAQGFYETFEARPEVWSAMLTELRSIENNTEKALEAEYNLPSGYQRPNRMWAMRQTGGRGGFGPESPMWDTWMEYLQQNKSYAEGGTIPRTGPYYLHKQEIVTSAETLSSTNNILNNTYRVLVLSAGYLSNINLGVLGVRQEIRQLRQQLTSQVVDEGTTNFDRITKANYIGVSSLGVRRK